jgi:salicylate hydroxylase
MRILIAGGGIGGLVAGLALAQRNVEVDILEQQAEPREFGAGISIYANGARVLSSLGLDDALRPLRHQSAGAQLRSAKTGRLVSELRLRDFHQNRFGAPAYDLHRGDLRGVLLDVVKAQRGIKLHLGQRVTSVSQEPAAISVLTEQGLRLVGDALIGADGIHSAVRNMIAGADAPRFSGEIVWRALVPRNLLTGAAQAPYIVIWMGGDRHFLQYPVRGGELLNIGGFVRTDAWKSESWTERGDKGEFARLFARFHPTVRHIIDAVDECFVQAIHEREPLSRWYSGRAVLLGDAAHAMLPHMGQGAGMAIEDAMVLARQIDSHREDLPAAFEAYEARRKDRVLRVAAHVRANAQLFRIDKPAQRAIVNAQMWLMSKISPTAPQERLAWLYEYDALSA